jgi:hydrogenase/urease accessory protein HupE
VLNWKLLNMRQRTFGTMLAAILAVGFYASLLNETSASLTTVFNFLSITLFMMSVLLHPLSFQQPSLEKFISVSTPKLCTVLLLLAFACWLLPLTLKGFLKLAS